MSLNAELSEKPTLSDLPEMESNDLGMYLNEKKNISDFRMKELLENHFKPPAGFQFPYSEHLKNGKLEKRYINQSHLDDYCVLFAPPEVGSKKC